MTNYERCKKDIDKLSLAVATWGVVNGEVKRCGAILCKGCAFHGARKSCESIRLEWLDQEYKEPEVDWSKVPVDAKILVSDDGKEWYHAHFAYFDDRYKKVRAWDGGGTRWTCEEYYGATGWDYAKLAEEEDDD